MPPPRVSLKKHILISAISAVSLVTTVSAQATTGTGDGLPALSTANDGNTNTRQSTGATQVSPASSATVTRQTTAAVVSNTQRASTASDTNTIPAITSTAASSNDLPDLPTLPGAYSYPPPSVPPTQNAPFMQTSSLPQGTVFIAVGAILGAFGLGVLIWRAVVACMLHRSVKRATLAQHLANDKASFPTPSAPFYKYSDRESTVSLGNIAAGRGVRRTQRGPIPSATPSQTNLFFSPTAPGGMNTAANRDSRLLPSGFYAAGSSNPGAQPGNSISMTNLRPDSRGHPRPIGHSPPDSPNHGARSNVNLQQRNLSTSTLNLNRPASQRAPSAYLEDLLDDNPGQFPPPGGFNQPGGRI